MNELTYRRRAWLLIGSVFMVLSLGCSDAGRSGAEWSADPLLARQLTQDGDAGPFHLRLPSGYAIVDDPHERYQDTQRGTETYRWLPPDSADAVPPMLTLTIHATHEAGIDEHKLLDAVLNGFFSSMQSEWPRAAKTAAEHGQLADRPAVRAAWRAPVDDELTVQGVIFAFVDGDRAVSLTLFASGEDATAHLKLLEAAALSLSK